MQKVERRKHGNRQRGRLIPVLLCALFLGACVTAGVLIRKETKVEPAESGHPISGAITDREAEELQSISVTRRAKDSWTLVREADGSLHLLREDGKGTEAWTADEQLGSMIQDAAVHLTYEDILTENPEEWAENPEDFGLADPVIRAEIRFTDGTGVTVRIGNAANPHEGAFSYMAVEGDERLYALGTGTVQDLDVDRELLHPVQELAIRSALLDRITVKNGDGTIRTEWALQGKVSDQDAAENWLLTVPLVYPADYETIQNLKGSAENLRLGTYIGPADQDSKTLYGLDTPSAVIELHMAAGSTGTVSDSGVYDVIDWEERTERLIMGKSRSEMVDYLQFGEEIYTISHFSVSSFTETTPISTAARYTVATPLNSLESLTLVRESGENVHYALIRPEGEEETESTAVCIRNGEEISYETFSAAYDRLLTVTVTGRLPEDFEPGTPHTKYTFRTVSGGTHTLELSDYDGMHDAVTMDGHTLFYLIQGGMTALP